MEEHVTFPSSPLTVKLILKSKQCRNIDRNKYLFEVGFDLLIFDFLGDSSDENLLDGLSGIGVISSLAGCRALGLNLKNKEMNKYLVEDRRTTPTVLFC